MIEQDPFFDQLHDPVFLSPLSPEVYLRYKKLFHDYLINLDGGTLFNPSQVKLFNLLMTQMTNALSQEASGEY